MPRRRPHAVASAAFTNHREVEQVMRQLLESGIARDLIEVATDPGTAKREFPGRLGHQGYTVLAYAGKGALIGVVLSMVLSLVLVFFADLHYAGPLSIVQLLGPNVGTLTGAVLGGLWGWLRPRPLADYYCRVKQTGGILLIVHCRTQAEAEQILTRLKVLGGREGQVAAA